MRGVHPGWWVLLLLLLIGVALAAWLIPSFASLLYALAAIAVAIIIVWSWLTS
ncbi:hypothetical protein [Prosthecomicrobium sp. N25]|uniref:hypothetical protein n=1 Tax=Prosthecomicrobium sp. N25 TaxID=3129254 RepID=UPI0030771BA5